MKKENNEEKIKENEAGITDENEVKEAKEAKEEKPAKDKKKDKSDGEIEKLRQELADKEDKYLRLYAEYDNFRKRSQKEKADIYSSSKADIINEFLPIIDNFERAAADEGADPEAYRKGIELIFKQFLGVLEKNGVESFGEEGETFDPAIHSAVMVVEDENLDKNVIAQVYSKGYKFGDKIIREAVVKVANT